MDSQTLDNNFDYSTLPRLSREKIYEIFRKRNFINLKQWLILQNRLTLLDHNDCKLALPEYWVDRDKIETFKVEPLGLEYEIYPGGQDRDKDTGYGKNRIKSKAWNDTLEDNYYQEGIENWFLYNCLFDHMQKLSIFKDEEEKHTTNIIQQIYEFVKYDFSFYKISFVNNYQQKLRIVRTQDGKSIRKTLMNLSKNWIQGNNYKLDLHDKFREMHTIGSSYVMLNRKYSINFPGKFIILDINNNYLFSIQPYWQLIHPNENRLNNYSINDYYESHKFNPYVIICFEVTQNDKQYDECYILNFRCGPFSSTNIIAYDKDTQTSDFDRHIVGYKKSRHRDRFITNKEKDEFSKETSLLHLLNESLYLQDDVRWIFGMEITSGSADRIDYLYSIAKQEGVPSIPDYPVMDIKQNILQDTNFISSCFICDDGDHDARKCTLSEKPNNFVQTRLDRRRRNKNLIKYKNLGKVIHDYALNNGMNLLLEGEELQNAIIEQMHLGDIFQYILDSDINRTMYNTENDLIDQIVQREKLDEIIITTKTDLAKYLFNKYLKSNKNNNNNDKYNYNNKYSKTKPKNIKSTKDESIEVLDTIMGREIMKLYEEENINKIPTIDITSISPRIPDPIYFSSDEDEHKMNNPKYQNNMRKLKEDLNDNIHETFRISSKNLKSKWTYQPRHFKLRRQYKYKYGKNNNKNNRYNSDNSNENLLRNTSQDSENVNPNNRFPHLF